MQYAPQLGTHPCRSRRQRQGAQAGAAVDLASHVGPVAASAGAHRGGVHPASHPPMGSGGAAEAQPGGGRVSCQLERMEAVGRRVQARCGVPVSIPEEPVRAIVVRPLEKRAEEAPPGVCRAWPSRRGSAGCPSHRARLGGSAPLSGVGEEPLGTTTPPAPTVSPRPKGGLRAPVGQDDRLGCSTWGWILEDVDAAIAAAGSWRRTWGRSGYGDGRRLGAGCAGTGARAMTWGTVGVAGGYWTWGPARPTWRPPSPGCVAVSSGSWWRRGAPRGREAPGRGQHRRLAGHSRCPEQRRPPAPGGTTDAAGDRHARGGGSRRVREAAPLHPAEADRHRRDQWPARTPGSDGGGGS